MTCGRLLQFESVSSGDGVGGKTVGAHAVLTATGANTQRDGVLTRSRWSALHLLGICEEIMTFSFIASAAIECISKTKQWHEKRKKKHFTGRNLERDQTDKRRTRERNKERGGGDRGEEHTHHTHISCAYDGRAKLSGSVVNALILQEQLITPA